jgi:hypothetical protein
MKHKEQNMAFTASRTLVTKADMAQVLLQTKQAMQRMGGMVTQSDNLITVNNGSNGVQFAFTSTLNAQAIRVIASK